jgi:hypothetical protein
MMAVVREFVEVGLFNGWCGSSFLRWSNSEEVGFAAEEGCGQVRRDLWQFQRRRQDLK